MTTYLNLWSLYFIIVSPPDRHLIRIVALILLGVAPSGAGGFSSYVTLQTTAYSEHQRASYCLRQPPSKPCSWEETKGTNLAPATLLVEKMPWPLAPFQGTFCHQPAFSSWPPSSPEHRAALALVQALGETREWLGESERLVHLQNVSQLCGFDPGSLGWFFSLLTTCHPVLQNLI